MAVPFIQIGQCGNQVGSAFYSLMHQEATRASPAHQALLQQFFDEEQQAKALLVDMEPKVVSRCLARQTPWRYNQQLALVREEGSGNNWAYGCYKHGPSIKEDLETVLRKLVEPEDYINMFVQLQSMAGGTGSGLGSYILSRLDKMFPKTPKVVCCVMPHLSGEVILQAYNATLSLGSIHSLADGIFLIENDVANSICTKFQPKPQLEDINR
jgi:tubulin delta